MHTDSSINHNHSHNHSRQSSFNRSIDRSQEQQPGDHHHHQQQQQPRTTSSGSMIESMLTKRQRDTKRATMHQQERVTHLDLESIEQSLASRRRALVYCREPDGRIIERERERVRAANGRCNISLEIESSQSRTSMSDLSAQWSISTSMH